MSTATVRWMLHIRQRTTAAASWAARGYPSLMRWETGRDEAPLLYWALTEVGPAATADDLDAVTDLLDEAELLLDRIWTEPNSGGRRHREITAISTALWSELQRGRGAEDLTEIALHARLLRNLVAPRPGQFPARPTTAVPAYRPPGNRIRGGRLPLTGQAPLGERDLNEQFLLLLAVVLSHGRGHLVDHDTGLPPRGADPDRTGWTRPDGAGAGVLLGSIRRTDRDHADLILRPGPCLTAVKRWVRTRPSVPGADRWTVEDIGRALAQAWLIDTTLILEPTLISRIHTAAWPVHVDRTAEQVWRLPLTVYHPRQLQPRGEGRPNSAGPLRPVPDR